MKIIFDETFDVLENEKGFSRINSYICYESNAENRGFYVSVYPEKVKNGIIYVCPFDGTNIKLPITVKRLSEKVKQEALKMYESNKLSFINLITSKYGLSLKKA